MRRCQCRGNVWPSPTPSSERRRRCHVAATHSIQRKHVTSCEFAFDVTSFVGSRPTRDTQAARSCREMPRQRSIPNSLWRRRRRIPYRFDSSHRIYAVAQPENRMKRTLSVLTLLAVALGTQDIYAKSSGASPAARDRRGMRRRDRNSLWSILPTEHRAAECGHMAPRISTRTRNVDSA